MDSPNLFKRNKKEIDFLFLKKSLEYYPASESLIDEVTWADLNMDDIYVKMEETLTAQGDEALYYSLHHPVFEPSLLAKRREMIRAFGENPGERETLRSALKKAGRLRYDFRRSIEDDFALSKKEKIMYLLGPLGLVFFILMLFLTQNLNLFLLIFLCILLNGSMHYQFTKKYEAQIDTLSYTYKLLNLSYSFAQKDFYKDYGLMPLYEKIRQTHRDISFIFQLDRLDFIAEYLNILFLFKERCYLKISKKLSPNATVLFALYEAIGQMDLYQSMSIFLENENNLICQPDFMPADQKHMQFEGLFHPLLENPIANSLTLTQSIVITGSNMSGKSTFLRTVGINVLLAQTWSFAYARSFSLCPMHIISSISLQDNIALGKSYFLQEADAIKRMLTNSKRRHCTLFLIDEIFKGTNPVERIAAATEICIELATSNCLGMVATHDLQLIPAIPQYLPYYFTEQVSKEDLHFDYKIHPGIASTRNAIKILEYLNYDSALIDRINQRL